MFTQRQQNQTSNLNLNLKDIFLLMNRFWLNMFRQSACNNNLGPHMFHLDHLSGIHVVYCNKIDQTF